VRRFSFIQPRSGNQPLAHSLNAATLSMLPAQRWLAGSRRFNHLTFLDPARRSKSSLSPKSHKSQFRTTPPLTPATPRRPRHALPHAGSYRRLPRRPPCQQRCEPPCPSGTPGKDEQKLLGKGAFLTAAVFADEAADPYATGEPLSDWQDLQDLPTDLESCGTILG
jgi:hypothetical protein